MFGAILGIISPLLTKVIGNVFPNPEDEIKRQEIQTQFYTALMAAQSQIDIAAADIIKAEAQGESWLQRNWRPCMMVLFGILISCRWFGYSAPNLQPAEYLELWGLIKLGLGGYVIGRSVEKTLPSVIEQFKTK